MSNELIRKWICKGREREPFFSGILRRRQFVDDDLVIIIIFIVPCTVKSFVWFVAHHDERPEAFRQYTDWQYTGCQWLLLVFGFLWLLTISTTSETLVV